LVVGSAFLGGAGALAVAAGQRLATESVEVELPNVEFSPLATRSVVFDASGQQLAYLHNGQNRDPVSLDEVPHVLIDTVLAAEDRNYYDHDGIDWKGIGRALVANLDAGGVREGGSTITQQLVKNTMFDDPERDLDRKVKEAVLALAVEEKYSKRQILQRYLNTIYMGNGAYGIRAAAERYFNKEPRDLTLADSALLAALIANPTGRDPLDHPAASVRARNRVLDSAVAAGSITQKQASEAREAPLPTALTPLPEDPIQDPFVEEVKRLLLRDERLGATYEERYLRVFEGGLRIYTTFDRHLQQGAEFAVRAHLPADLPYTATLVAVDNATGAVRAMVAGTSVAQAGFNLATQGTRQTGSAFKAITLTAAIANGYSPSDRVNASGECEFDMGPYAAPWKVHNYDGKSMGTTNLTTAIANSSNCAFARVALSLGADKIVDMAHKLGIARDLEAVPSITLGTQPVSPLDMAGAFSTLANEGTRRPLRFIDRVENSRGKVLFEEGTDGEHVLDNEVARTVTSMLTEVVNDGTGTRAAIGRPVAGKTGTNQSYRDAWFVGYTPQLTASVWIGNADAQIPITIDGIRVTGGSFPAMIWHDFMAFAHEGMPIMTFTPPDESRWPPGGSISEKGRNIAPPRSPRPPSPPPTIAPPPTVPEPVAEPSEPERKHKKPKQDPAPETTLAPSPTTVVPTTLPPPPEEQ
jgi:penicillin-binding protein 1A